MFLHVTAPAPLFVVLRVLCHLYIKHFEVEGVERVGALGLSSPVSFEFFYVGKKSERPHKILSPIPSHSRHLLKLVTVTAMKRMDILSLAHSFRQLDYRRIFNQ